VEECDLQLVIKLAFFEGDTLLGRSEIICAQLPASKVVEGGLGTRWTLSFHFEEPACPVEMICEKEGVHQYRSALRFGVHDSEDWEDIELGDLHALAFKCEMRPQATACVSASSR